jgi:nitroreductase
LDFLEVVKRRRTTNGPFLPDPVSEEHQRLLVEVAAMAPSHFNSQPWRFVLVDDRDTMEEKRDGIHFDQMPGVLKPFRRQIFSSTGQAVMNRFGVPKTLGEDNRKLVAGSPLLLAVLLDTTEYRPGELSGFYSVFGMGAAVENIWLTTAAIGMGIQFVSTPMEIPENWQKLQWLLKVPDDLELMAVYRLGYVPQEQRRPTIDWSSRQRKRISQYVFRNTCEQPEPEPDVAREAGPATR